MAQHFLLSKAARSFSLVEIARMTEKQAESFFRKIRWDQTNGKPVCPCCGSIGKHYYLNTRSIWKCKDCHKQFSITSGTLFASHKLSLRTYVMAIALFVNEVKGMSALKLSRELNIQYKTAFVLLHKFREALLETRDETPMDGVCEIDGAYVNHYVRPANNINDRIDRRLIANQNPNKRCIIVVRQRYSGEAEFIGSKRTLTYVLHNENTTDIMNIANNRIVEGTELHADEANAYDSLHARYEMRRVNHSIEYMSEENACSNQAESFFARFRRFQQGQIHKMGQLYISNYANEIAYREDTRRLDNRSILEDISVKCMKTLQSNEWTGYWQGNHRVSERLGVA
ncbi:IS1595 family transposase [Poseidonibacter ostreae]|uniref:IS1595 family transposase n=1 Tax=Poseidonibacter ostreae TaxID=2654171 RepID=A0A6L4WNV7_9BACT|nr:IS1595 family transposase [Poseidonibacter ostreae]KAB7884301.1 IS1595 family transposase [Poseidonibacter ostreae]KAB7885284.1 IS1595 family transposase [Poseidonibacter ostreae]KAB7891960.1 IS1595 family transposase [Poseidonibacter ostreae]